MRIFKLAVVIIILVWLGSCGSTTKKSAQDTNYGIEPRLHYRPAENEKVGDLIPYYWDGEYHVFYLKQNEWNHLVSTDMIHWKELPVALSRGTDPGGPDYEGIWTGSVVEKDGMFYIFYTGKNFNDPLGDQKVMRASSYDLVKWEKDEDFIFYADGKIYWNKNINGPIDDKHAYHHQAFRDPHVVWNEEKKEWWMGFHALLSDGSDPVVSLYTSKDLDNWVPQQPFVTYPASVSGDCPDIFWENGLWNILLADYHYVQVREPGVVYPEVNQYDCGDLRVPKAMYDGIRRIIMGWIGDCKDKTDRGEYEWGGVMSMPREIYPGSGGKLFQKPLKEIVDYFNSKVLEKRVHDAGEFLNGLPQNYMLHAFLRAQNTEEKITLYFRQKNIDDKDSYHLTINFKNNEISLGNKYRDHIWECNINPADPVDIRLFVDGTVAECFINDSYCFTMRIYDQVGDGISFYSDSGILRVDLAVYTPGSV